MAPVPSTGQLQAARSAPALPQTPQLVRQPARLPVLLVPPFVGNRLEVQISDRRGQPNAFLAQTQDWQRLWFRPTTLLPLAFDSFAYNMQLIRGKEVGQYESPPGVRVRLEAGLESSLQLNPSANDTLAMPVYKGLYAMLHGLGYRNHADLECFHYDWRLTPDAYMAPGGQFSQLKRAFEALAERAGQPVAAITYSMSAPLLTLFLGRYVDDAWKRRHIAGTINLAGTWAGCPLAALVLATGTWGRLRWALKQASARQLVRGLPSLSWLLPHPHAYGDRPIIDNRATGKSYTAGMMGELLRDAGAHQSADVWEAIRDKYGADPPGVPTYCFYGQGLDAVGSVTFADAAFDEVVDLRKVPGDGLVPECGLTAADAWAARQAEPAAVRRFRGVSHIDFRDDPAVMDATRAALHELCDIARPPPAAAPAAAIPRGAPAGRGA